MTDFQKSLTRFMYLALIVVAVIGAWALGRPASSGERANDYNQGVTATGTCIVRTKPDLVEVTIGVRQSSQSARVAKDYVKSHVSKVISVLTKQGIAAKDIQTESFGLSPSWDSDKNYVVWGCNEKLRVRIRKIDSVADVVDEVVKAGANQIEDIQYTVDDVNALRAKGRVKAAKVAREKAAQLASSLGGKIGRLRSVNEYYPSEYGDYYGRRDLMRANIQATVNEPSGADSAREEITIQPGEMTLTVVVSATYELM